MEKGYVAGKRQEKGGKHIPGPRLGAHVSISGGLPNAFDRGRDLGCETIQVFTRNQTQWRARPLGAAEIDAFFQADPSGDLQPVLAHDSYLINLASPQKELWQKSCGAFYEEMLRADSLHIPFLVFHPGSHTGSGEQDGLKNVSQALNQLIEKTGDSGLRILIESTAGQGSSLGYRFEQLALLLEWTERKDRIGICLDTCHIFAAGYDIRTEKSYFQTMEAFDSIVGLKRLFAFHVNDSRKELGSRVDRHEHIGQGHIGLEGFRCLVNDARLHSLPMILETPGEDEDFHRNLTLLRSLIVSE
jgi:deoxyribonuclease-4